MAPPVTAKPAAEAAAKTEKPAAVAAAKTEPKPAAAELLGDASACHTLGRKLIQEGKFTEAIQVLTQAIQLNPSLALAYNARGYAHIRLRQFREAIADFDQAIKLDPNYSNAYLNRGSAKRASGDKPGGDADMAKASELSQR